ncbi:MAG: TRC40/GET3/ArsA family transport-energizing ATPase [Candidatus Thermoplasmatota archaeon]
MKELEKFVFFAGKGGVGKTTCSSIYALKCSKGGLKTLLVSTDPAHSTDKILETTLSENEKKIKEDLWAKQIDASKEAKSHRKKIEKEMKQVVGPDMMNKLQGYLKMTHNSPGVKESALLDALIRTMKESERYDKVVFDTAPTGETMRLLQLPELLSSWSERLIERRKENLEKLGKVGDKSKIDLEDDPLIKRLKSRENKLKFGRKVLLNRSSVVPVITPEKLSMLETKDSIKSLENMGVDIPGVVLNRVASETASEKRKNYEKKILNEIKKKMDKKVMGRVPLMEEEIIGIEQLSEHINELEIR